MSFFVSSVENLFLGLTSENFQKISIFFGESSSPDQGTESGFYKGSI